MDILIDKPAWKNLKLHRDSLTQSHMRDLFAADKKRFEKFSARFETLFIDYSKNLITTEVLASLLELAKQCNVHEFLQDMISGRKINFTENRAVLHTALRSNINAKVFTDRSNFQVKIKAELSRIQLFSEKIRNGDTGEFSNKRITDVVCLGIGGSHLGPELVVHALRSFDKKRLNLHFIANLDGLEVQEKLATLKPEKTLVIIISKSFKTTETLSNARLFDEWLNISLGIKQTKKQLIAITANKKSAIEFGISTKNIFSIWEWVGGRFSLWSAVGLPIAIALGYETFENLLQGAEEMDQHLLTSPPDKNLPLILALISIWNVNFLDIPTHSIIPYDTRLKWLPRFLQQLEMESNGKSINFLGKSVSYQTAPVIFGQVGTEAQHSFFQLLHQGTQPLSCDFLLAVERPTKKDVHYESVVANAFAQSEALMSGITEKNAKAELLKKRISKTTLTKLLPHKALNGNRPSNTLIYRRLDPATLGMLLALYEHKVAIQGKIWQINSFDQWGVEYGKQLANTIKNALVDLSAEETLNPSTANLVSIFQKMRKEPH